MDTQNINKNIERAKKKFTKIPNFIIVDGKLSDAAFRTYALLKSFKFGKGKVFPAIKTLSSLREKSERTIFTHLKELASKRLLASKRRGFSKTNLYFFIGEENFTNELLISEENFTSLVKKTSPQSCKKLHGNNTEHNKTKLNKRWQEKDKGKEILRQKLRELGLKK